MIRILTGDCRDVLPTLEAGSVHCVVTSPPYYGLRDYGTAQWDGGDAACDHSMSVRGSDPVPPSCRQCQKCGRLSRTRWISASSVRSECDQCGVTTDYTDVESRGTLWGVKRDADGEWALPSKRLPGDFCRCGARRIDRQLGLEVTSDAYIQTMVEVFREVRRVLRDDGTCWVNMGDSFSGKQLLMMPARLALALQADGWWLRSDIIISKRNPMPESVTDRCTSAHEHLFMLTKSARYYFDAAAIREGVTGGANPQGNGYGIKADVPGRGNRANYSAKAAMHNATRDDMPTSRNCRDVWEMSTYAFKGSHFATFAPELAERCIRAGTSEKGACPQCGAPWYRVTNKSYTAPRGSSVIGAAKGLDKSNGWSGYPVLNAQTTTIGWHPTCACDKPGPVVPCTVLDPFSGAGTSGLVADRLGRDAVMIDLNHQYVEMARERLQADCPLFADITDAPVPEPPEDERMADLFAEAAE